MQGRFVYTSIPVYASGRPRFDPFADRLPALNKKHVRRRRSWRALRDRWWPQKAKQEGDTTTTRFTWCVIVGKRKERPVVEASHLKRAYGRCGAPSRKGYAVSGQVTRQATNGHVPVPASKRYEDVWSGKDYDRAEYVYTHPSRPSHPSHPTPNPLFLF